MKKCLTLLLALLMMLQCTAVFAEAAVPMADETATPQVGDVIHGFEVMEVTDFPLINADVTYFVHQKTGAELLYLANDDTNRAFELTFRTPAESDMGVPHVFEHATLSGSEKYPSRDLFFNLSNQTYNTYMNASTYSIMTTYPVSSLSEDQLYMYADYYTDSCLHPIIHTDESIFREEAWRYSMDSAESDLTLSGTVYTEMQGSYTVSRAAYHHWRKTMFPGSNAGNESGGIPSEIANMTWEDVKTFHHNYYHPSNSLACLYGSFENYERFLELLDGYYSAYEKADIVIADANYKPITGAQTAQFEYPVEAGSDTDHGGRLLYGFRVDDADEATVNSIDMLTTLLGSSSLPVMAALEEALPAASCGCYLLLDTPEPAIVFGADGVNAEDAEVFQCTVDTALKDLLAQGLNQEAVDAIAASFNMEIKLYGESSTLGTDMIPNIAYYWAATGDWHDYLNYIASLDQFASLNEDGTFTALIEKFLVNNENKAMTVTVPVAGLKEQNDAALAAELAEIKAAMTEEEIAAIVESTQALSQQHESTAAEYVAQLQAVTVDTLPEECRIYDYTDVTGEDGVRRIDIAANVDGVGRAMFLLDVSDMPQEYLHWFQLYIDLLGEVDTTAHSRQDLNALVTRYLYDAVLKASLPYDGQTTLYLRGAWIASDEDMQSAYDLLDEILFDSQFTDVQRVMDAVSARKTSLKTSLTQDIYNSQLLRAQAASDANTKLYIYLTDLDYYAFLEQAEAMLAEQPEQALAMLRQVQAFVNNGTGAISAFAGSPESAANHRGIADAFLAKLNTREVVPAVYDLPTPARSEGIVVDSSVQYNLIYATWEEMGLEEYTADFHAVTKLVEDLYLNPLLRSQYGVYTVYNGVYMDGMYLLTYRDPNVAETFAVYEQLPAMLADMTVDQETLDGYILSAYAGYAMPYGELAGATNAIFTIILGDDQAESLTWMKQLKALKAEDLSKYVTAYEKLVANGVRSTAGGAGAIEASTALFGVILNPFNAVDPTTVEFADCTAEHPYYDAVRFAFENGMMLPASDAAFGTGEAGTLGDFAMACYVMLGGGQSPEEAVAYLAQYGIVPAEAVDTALTHEQLVAYTVNFATAMGVPVTAEMLPAFEDTAATATRAETAMMLLTFYQMISGE